LFHDENDFETKTEDEYDRDSDNESHNTDIYQDGQDTNPEVKIDTKDHDLDDHETDILQELLFGLIMNFCTEPIPNGNPAATMLVYFTGILGFSKDLQGFQGPRNFTSYLAALVYLMRLLSLEYAIPAHGYKGLSIPARSPYGRLDRLQAIRQKYLVLGCESPFGEIYTLMCYGRKAAENQAPAITMQWNEDKETVSISNACTIKMGELRELSRYLIKEAWDLCQELLFGIEPDFRLDRIKDSWS
jgi:hypothetical protein